jgi:O-acetylserine/cysteine efflux transporter
MSRQTPPVSQPQQEISAQGVVLISILLLVDSLHFIFARLLLPYIGPPLSVLYVLGIATLEVGIYGAVTGKLRFAYLGRYWKLFSAIGFCIGVSTIINYEAVAFIDAGTASMLGKTTVLFGVGFGIFWLGDRLSRLQIVGSAIAILGLVVISFQPGDYLRLGALLIIGSTFLYALHAALSKRYGQDMDLVNFFFYRLLFTSIVLIAIVAGSGSLALPPSPRAWLLLGLAGTVDVVISRSLYYIALRRLNMSIFSIMLTAGPVAAVLWSLLLFGTFPTAQQLMGGAGVLIGVALVTAAPLLEKRHKRDRLEVNEPASRHTSG